MPHSAGLGVLLVALACGSVLSGGTRVFAQSRQTDQELKDLIPDSAIDNPQAWANQPVPAANAPTSISPTSIPGNATPPTPDAALAAADPSQPLPDLSGLVLAWPDTATMPTIDPLAPDTDLAAANAANAAAARELATQERATLRPGDTTTPRTARNDTISVGRAVELAFPVDLATFPDREAFALRFGTLSSLKSLDSKSDTIAQVGRRAEADRKALVSLMRLYGYYDPEVIQTIGGNRGDVARRMASAETAASSAPTPPATDATAASAAPEPTAERPAVRFDIVPGPLYHLRTVTLGDLEATGIDYPMLRAAYPMKIGDPANTDRILSADMQLTTALGEHGYVFGTVGDGELTIDHDPRLGDLAVPVTNGGKFAFGKVISESPDFLSSDHLRRIARFKAGQVAKKSGLDDLRQAVLATGLVSSVTITPRKVIEPQGGSGVSLAVPGTIDVDVAMIPAPLRTVAGQLGYSSGQGARLELSWENRNLFPPEGMLRVRGVAGTREQLAGITFRRNNFRTRDQVLTADLFVQNVKYTAYTAKTVSFITTLQRQATILFQKPFTYSVGFEAVATRDTNGSTIGQQSIPQTYFVIALPLQAGYDGSDNLLDPTRGFRLNLRVSPEASRTLGQQSTYVKSQFDASIYHTVAPGVVLAGRARFGSITGADIASIAPSRRFYAGGGGSVRGYGYQQIGPKDTAGLPSGGRSLTEFGLEARVKTGFAGGAVSVVPFVDAGSVDQGSTPAFRDIKVGVGLGIRYLTNFGPIRIDVGTPLNKGPKDSRVGVYVALGQAF
ncbi:BamA/TamA family outer membrane protein [Novosphingobium sp.]|uniref:autotransporter assembly complex protein TamA n=1 Tax=Novosphingobium sp. TaxID=1874826 RepID=UPI0025F19F75|nr:BamA/TamA family outer membrane protein [Novosphingobium sp.]